MKRRNEHPRGEFAPFLPIGEAINALLYPHAEIVIHDSRSDRIVAIWNAFSRRQLGDSSLLGDDVELQTERDVYGPYEKANWNGERLKSVTAALANGTGDRIGVICINLDVSRFDDAIKLLQSIAMAPGVRPATLFRNDFREAVNLAVADFLVARNMSMSAMSKSDRVDLVAFLAGKRLFEARGAANHVASALGVSRATIYAWLATARNSGRLDEFCASPS
jgi:predicted transcriptional regulator YheO